LTFANKLLNRAHIQDRRYVPPKRQPDFTGVHGVQDATRPLHDHGCEDPKRIYMLLSRHQNAGQNHDIKRANRCFENVAQFGYLGTTVTNQNPIQEEIERILDSGNACYQSVQKLLSSRLLSKNVKIRIYETVILFVVLHGCEKLVSDIKGGTLTEGV
jgi:hypothetical protein